MNKIEIRQRKKLVLPFLLIGIFVIAGTGFGIFSSEKYKNNTTTKISFFIGVAFFCYLIYSPLRRLIKNQPILVFEDDSIILNTNTPVTIKKQEIEGISVTYVDETGYFLNIQTKDTTHEMNISWLDKTPDEIKELIKVY